MTEATATAPEPTDNRPVPVPVREDVVTTYENLADSIPTAGDEGIEGILEAIASASTAADLDRAWQAGGMGRLLNVPIVVQSIAKMEATYDGPLPFFLVIRGGIADTGELFVATTGSVSVVAQLTVAWARGWFPLKCVLREAKRESRNGQKPQHLEMVR